MWKNLRQILLALEEVMMISGNFVQKQGTMMERNVFTMIDTIQETRKVKVNVFETRTKPQKHTEGILEINCLENYMRILLHMHRLAIYFS